MNEIKAVGRRAGRSELARSAVLVASIALGLAAGLFVLWTASTALLLVAAGLLLAVVFDAVAGGLGYLVAWHRRWRLFLVVVLFFALVGGAVALGGARLIQQFGELSSLLEQQIQDWSRTLNDLGLTVSSEDDRVGLGNLMPAGQSVFGGATQALALIFGGISNAILVMFLAVFFAWEPKLYRSSIVSLVPQDKRARLAEVIDRSRDSLAWWIAGQAISMTVIFVLSLIMLMLIGMPLALFLALQAGLLAFIPIIGPVIAGIVIVIVGLSNSMTMGLYGLGAYLVIQLVESNVLMPVVQERAVRLPPAFTLGFQLLFGYLFGFLGLALAVPIAAAGKVFVQELYVKDRLGGSWEE